MAEACVRNGTMSDVNRKMTDIPCLLVFIAFFCYWGYLYKYALHHGHPKRMVYPHDPDGNLFKIYCF